MLITLFLAAAAAPAVAAPAVKSTTTLQQRFDAATAAGDAGDCAAAVPAFEALEASPAVTKAATVRGAVLLRKGICQVALGREDAGASAIEQGLSLLPATPAFASDRYQGEQQLGRVDFGRLRYDAAKVHFARTLGIATTPATRIIANTLLLRTALFNPSDEALGYADAALAEAKRLPGKSKDQLAGVRTLRARVLLVRGDNAGALAELQQSLKEQGGLGTRVSLSDVVTRSDLAIAALLSKLPERAREYLAYTGAGRTTDTPFGTAAAMAPPACGVETGLRPDDTAIVEFSIKDDGSVGSAHPIWASRRDPAMIEFARAVSGWSWAPEAARKVSPFFRAVTRVELRCSTATDRPSALAGLWAALGDWLGEPALVGERRAAVTLPQLRAAVTSARASGGKPLILALMRVATSPLSDRDETRAVLVEARRLTAQLNAPPAVLAAVGYHDAFAASSTERRAVAPLTALLAEPGIAGDAQAAGALRLVIGDLDLRGRDRSGATALFRQVADDARLPSVHPLKVGALLRLADAELAGGNVEAARASFAKTGLDEQQCALVGPTPVMTNSGAGSSDFPMEAARWGFEGWVRFETDIRADGRTQNARAIIAYPPFVFRDAALGIARDMRFTQSYRPAGTLGCGGLQQSIAFRWGH